MAVIGETFLDLIDVYKRQTDTRAIATIIELLSQTNEVLKDATAVECNQGVNHLTTVRTGLPSVAWGLLYKGIPQSKSDTAQVTDTTGFAEGLSTIDKRLLDIAKDPSKARLTEATAFLESLNQEVSSKLFYGNTSSDPEQFMGLAPRFSDTSAPNGGQIVDGGGSGSDNTSIWIVGWSEATCSLLYPEGTKAGIARDDKGEQRVVDENGDAYYAMEELFRWHVGLSVRDWRHVVRIPNIDVSDLAAGSVDIMALLRQGYWKLKSHRLMGGKLAIYCNSNVCEAIDAATTPTSGTSSSYVRLSPDEVDGKEVMSYRSIPIRQCDAILNTEAAVS